jgi:hypothetical protein
MPGEVKLFGELCRQLGGGPNCFAILNSQGQVEIESMAWSVVPRDIKQAILTWAANPAEAWEPKENWAASRKAIQFADAKGWCVVWAETTDPRYLEEIAREEMRPTFPPE